MDFLNMFWEFSFFILHFTRIHSLYLKTTLVTNSFSYLFIHKFGFGHVYAINLISFV